VGVAIHFFGRSSQRATDAYGSARLAGRADLEAAEQFEDAGYHLGSSEDKEGDKLLRCARQRHLLTCASPRAGKGASAIISNLLTY